MPQPDNPSYDAVIVLANLLECDGSLNVESRVRLAEAARCITAGLAPVLVCCGWTYGGRDIAVADAMKRDAIERHRLPETAVLTEPAPRDTVGEAVFTKINLARPRHWHAVLVVTSNYHLPRALAIFSYVYGSDIRVQGRGVEAAEAGTLACGEARSLEAFHATFRGVASGDDAAILERLCARHPYYNGDVHPRWEPHR